MPPTTSPDSEVGIGCCRQSNASSGVASNGPEATSESAYFLSLPEEGIWPRKMGEQACAFMPSAGSVKQYCKKRGFTNLLIGYWMGHENGKQLLEDLHTGRTGSAIRRFFEASVWRVPW